MRHAQHQRRRSGVMMSNATYHTFACPAIVAKKMKTHRARQATTNPARQAVREGRSLSALKWYNTYTPLHLLRTFCFFFLFVFPLLIVLRVFLPCSIFVRFVLSSSCFPFVSCITFFVSGFASLLSLVADSVILLSRPGVTPPPRSVLT